MLKFIYYRTRKIFKSKNIIVKWKNNNININVNFIKVKIYSIRLDNLIYLE